jgi:hypothetical protein
MPISNEQIKAIDAWLRQTALPPLCAHLDDASNANSDDSTLDTLCEFIESQLAEHSSSTQQLQHNLMESLPDILGQQKSTQLVEQIIQKLQNQQQQRSKPQVIKANQQSKQQQQQEDEVDYENDDESATVEFGVARRQQQQQRDRSRSPESQTHNNQSQQSSFASKRRRMSRDDTVTAHRQASPQTHHQHQRHHQSHRRDIPSIRLLPNNNQQMLFPSLPHLPNMNQQQQQRSQPHAYQPPYSSASTAVTSASSSSSSTTQPIPATSALTRLYLSHIPSEYWSMQILLSYFTQFGTVVNVQLQSPDNAQIEYALPSEANAAASCPDAICGNRFIQLSRKPPVDESLNATASTSDANFVHRGRGRGSSSYVPRGGSRGTRGAYASRGSIRGSTRGSRGRQRGGNTNAINGATAYNAWPQDDDEPPQQQQHQQTQENQQSLSEAAANAFEPLGGVGSELQNASSTAEAPSSATIAPKSESAASVAKRIAEQRLQQLQQQKERASGSASQHQQQQQPNQDADMQNNHAAVSSDADPLAPSNNPFLNGQFNNSNSKSPSAVAAVAPVEKPFIPYSENNNTAVIDKHHQLDAMRRQLITKQLVKQRALITQLETNRFEMSDTEQAAIKSQISTLQRSIESQQQQMINK